MRTLRYSLHHLRGTIKPTTRNFTVTNTNPPPRPRPHNNLTLSPIQHQQSLTTTTMALPTTKTSLLYQKDGQKHTHSAPISTCTPLSSLPPDAQALFKPPPGDSTSTEPYVLTTPSTIFHVQGGGQPSDTGVITCSGGGDDDDDDNATEPSTSFAVHQVRSAGGAVLHMGTFSRGGRSSSRLFAREQEAVQEIDVAKRTLHSRIHTAGHILGLAAALLRAEGVVAADVVDGKASHYPGAAFVEFVGLIPGDVKGALQAKADELVARDLAVKIHFWDEERARSECTGVLDSFKQDEDGVRVVEIGDVGSYPCGGTHVLSTKGCGRVVVRNIKRQKGITKVSYEVVDA